MQNELKNQNDKKGSEDDNHKEKHHHPPHDVPVHILKEIMDLKEKVGRLEGKMEVLLKMQK